MKKNKKIFYSIIALILLVLIVGGVYFAQREYYKQKAIKNTRFISIIKNEEISDIESRIGDVVDTTLNDVVWTQSHIKDDKYYVTCTGDYHGTDVKFEFYIHEGDKSDKLSIFDKNRFYVRKNNRSVDKPYALIIILSEYAEKKGITLPDMIKATRDITLVMSNNMPMDKYEIDYKVFENTIDTLSKTDSMKTYTMAVAINDIIENYNKNHPEGDINGNLLQVDSQEETEQDIYINDPELNEYD